LSALFAPTQGSTPAGAGVCEQNVGGEREQPGAAKVDRDNALRGGDVILRTEDHGQERGFPGNDEKVGGKGLSSHEVWAQKGELHGGTPGCSPACVRVDEHLH
jgi:hypothetical protein